VINRPGLRTVLSEKFLEVFGWFETELENVQKIYESQKVIKHNRNYIYVYMY